MCQFGHLWLCSCLNHLACGSLGVWKLVWHHQQLSGPLPVPLDEGVLWGLKKWSSVSFEYVVDSMGIQALFPFRNGCVPSHWVCFLFATVMCFSVEETSLVFAPKLYVTKHSEVDCCFFVAGQQPVPVGQS